MYYLSFSFQFYYIPRNGDLMELNLVFLPFLLGAASLWTCLEIILTCRELATLIVLFNSMPLIFRSGFIWLVEVILEPVTTITQYTPLVPAIKMFLGINQRGADFMMLLPV